VSCHIAWCLLCDCRRIRIAPNISADIRYCVYFRVTHVGRPQKSYRPECMTNIWLEYEGLRKVLNMPLRQIAPAATPAALQSSTSAGPAAGAQASTVALPPEYAAAEALLRQAFVEQKRGAASVALALFERGLDKALVGASAASAMFVIGIRFVRRCADH
jgi:hypothetical protein